MSLGLTLTLADNSVEAGIYRVWSRLSTGRLKVFRTCQNFFSEYRIYRRDEKGKIIKQDDHLVDVLRYGCASAIDISVMCPFNEQLTRPGMPAALARPRHQIDYNPLQADRPGASADGYKPATAPRSFMPHRPQGSS